MSERARERRAEAQTLFTTVDDEGDGDRLDRVLCRAFPDHTRSELARWIEAGRVRVDGKPAQKTSAKVRRGSAIEADPMPPPPSELTADASVPFTVLYEDDAIVVVDKPAGVVVHPGKGNWSSTLVHGLLAHAEIEDSDENDDGPPRPGIVHRIDKDTSGALVVAKTVKARERLKELFATHDLEREYDALALGVIDVAKTIDTLHGRHPTDRKRFSSKVRTGKRAVTHVTPVEPLGAVTRVVCRLETGRTHQIRVHLAESGTPLLADKLYGKTPRDPEIRAIDGALGRQALHARLLAFAHPITAKPMRFEAPWPEDFASAVAALRKLAARS